jgi:hypothetical protein
VMARRIFERDAEEVLGMVAYARSYERLRAALGWPRWRVVRAVRRLQEAGRVYVVKSCPSVLRDPGA